MASVQDHYSALLSEVYSWMLGGFDAALARNREFVRRHGLKPRGSGLAIDAGAGCGFQSIPLAEAGYTVRALDTDAALLRELEAHAAGLPIVTIRDDIRNVGEHASPASVELLVCMTDTVLLLASAEEVSRFFWDAHALLEADGRLVLTYRELTSALEGSERFIPVRADSTAVLTCFLEYEPDTVNVHDLLYVRRGENWEFAKSHYKKLRLSKEWIAAALESAGFRHIGQNVENGLVAAVATK